MFVLTYSFVPLIQKFTMYGIKLVTYNILIVRYLEIIDQKNLLKFSLQLNYFGKNVREVITKKKIEKARSKCRLKIHRA